MLADFLPLPPKQLCYNKWSLEHTMLSVLAHCSLAIYRIVNQRNKTKRRSSENIYSRGDTSSDDTTEEEDSSDSDSEEFPPCYGLRGRSYIVLQHYILVWLSVLSSPKGNQLDCWLLILGVMDLGPILVSIYKMARFSFAFGRNPFREATAEYYMYNRVVSYQLTQTMRKWSPAYQLNEMIMVFVEGSLMKHAYILFMFTMSITQTHRFLVSNLYCKQLHMMS